MNSPDIKRIPIDGPVYSPYIEDTNIQYAWDSTSIGYLKTCPRLYQYTMIEGWTAKDENIHLYFGIEYHKALEEFDKFKAAGDSHDDAILKVLKNLLTRTYGWTVDEDIKPGKYKNRRSLIRSVMWHMDQFKVDPAQTLILADGSAAVELSFRFELDFSPQYKAQRYLLCGHLDRVVTYQEELFVMDHKTSVMALTPYYWNQFEPNNQMTLYSLAASIILHSPIKGVIIDAAQLLVSDTRFGRTFTRRTPQQLEEWVKSLSYWFTLAEQFAKANYWPMNDTACDKFGGCKFRGICSKSPQVREQFLKAHFTKLPPEERWNPLKPR